MTRWRSVLALAVALLLVLPAAAVSQNAGDQQYTDPLAPAQPRDDGGGSGSAPGSSGSAPPSTPSPPPADDSAAAQSQGAVAEAAPARNELPRTGFPAALLALAGGGMFGAGFALRRRLG